MNKYIAAERQQPMPALGPLAQVKCIAATARVLTAAIGLPVLVQGYEQLSKTCYESDRPDQAIEACSAVILAGVVDRNDLATAFKNRAQQSLFCEGAGEGA
jgi:hypothetical protein